MVKSPEQATVWNPPREGPTHICENSRIHLSPHSFIHSTVFSENMSLVCLDLHNKNHRLDNINRSDSGLKTAAFSLSAHVAFPWCIHVGGGEGEMETEGEGGREKSFSSYKDTNPIKLGSHPYVLI